MFTSREFTVTLKALISTQLPLPRETPHAAVYESEWRVPNRWDCETVHCWQLRFVGLQHAEKARIREFHVGVQSPHNRESQITNRVFVIRDSAT